MTVLRKLLGRHRVLGGVMALTLGSQVVSAGSTLLLHLLGLRTADVYAVAAQIGLTGFTGVTVGILYNIAIGRPQFDRWRQWSIIASLVSVTASLFQAVTLSLTDFVAEHGPPLVLTVFIIFGASGCLLSYAATIAVRSACEGKPVLFASVTLYPNAGYALGIGIALVARAPIAPAVGWLLGSFVLWLVARRTGNLGRRSMKRFVSTDIPDTSMRRQVSGLVLGVVASTFMPMLFLAALTQLPVGIVYVATLVSRIVNAAVSLTVNSALLVRFNWNTSSPRGGTTTSWAGGVFALGTCMTAVLLQFGISSTVATSMVVISWLVGVVSSSILTRELNADRLGGTIFFRSAIEVAGTGVFALLLFAFPSLVGYFACFAISAANTLIFSGVAFKRKMLLVSGCVASVACVVLLLRG